jgi:hypothetical protein
MSGGGSPSRTTQVSEPWGGAQPYLRDVMAQAGRLASSEPSYYGGPLTVGALPSEQSAFQQQSNYAQSVFGDNSLDGRQPSLQYGNVTGALNNQVSGNTTLGGMANQLAPQATGALGQQFSQGPSSLGGNYNINPNAMAPQFGRAGSLDATGAYQRMLSGTPDYAGAQGAIDAANAPILRQFEQDVLPGLNERATFLNNPTGGYKQLNRILPEMGERMSNNAQTIMNQERLRALSAQESAAGAISQGGLQSWGMGLDAASRQAGLNLQADTTNAGLRDSYRADVLNYGSLAGQLAGQSGQQQLGAAGMFPSIYGMGQESYAPSFQYANWQRGLSEDALAADQDRFNYLRDAPWQNLNQYAGIIQPGAGLGGSMTASGRQGRSGSSQAAGALGGAISGAQMGSAIGPWGGLIGGVLGGAAGYFGG